MAGEVRKLAEKSQAAAKDIGELAVESVDIANTAGTLLGEIVPAIKQTADLVQEILLASRSLSFMANRGRIVPELDVPHIKELIVNEYRLLYHIEESRIVLLGCIHGKRHLKKLWQKRKKISTRLQ